MCSVVGLVVLVCLIIVATIIIITTIVGRLVRRGRRDPGWAGRAPLARRCRVPSDVRARG